MMDEGLQLSTRLTMWMLLVTAIGSWLWLCSESFQQSSAEDEVVVVDGRNCADVRGDRKVQQQQRSMCGEGRVLAGQRVGIARSVDQQPKTERGGIGRSAERR